VTARSQPVKPRAIRHHVFARYRGCVASVNAFPDAPAAEAMTVRLRERYRAYDVTFWQSTEKEKVVPWSTLRPVLLQREPVLVERAKAIGDVLIIKRSAPTPTTAQAITDYLACGGAITLCKPRRAANPPMLRRERRSCAPNWFFFLAAGEASPARKLGRARSRVQSRRTRVSVELMPALANLGY
jgi:hypothetical protein